MAYESRHAITRERTKQPGNRCKGKLRFKLQLKSLYLGMSGCRKGKEAGANQRRGFGAATARSIRKQL